MNARILSRLITTVLVAAGVATALGQEMAGGMEGSARVTITNRSPQTLSPPLVISHGSGYAPFTVGAPASPELAVLAEDGDASELAVVARVPSGTAGAVVADGPVPPGESVTLEVPVTEAAPYVTVLSMLVTSNDAFLAWTGQVPDGMAMNADMAMDMDGGDMGDDMSMGGPSASPRDGVVRVYDAGTEANTEACAHVPGPPCGSAGARVADGAEGHVQLHGGILGVGDLEPTEWDWTHPVAEITVEP